jgi:serine/threonine protein kinase
VTEYAWNGSLAAHLPVGKTRLSDATQISKIITGIALAMRDLHSCGVLHRDLRPENIFLNWDWNVRIGDFGHAFSLSLQGQGTPLMWPLINSRYMAPECYKNKFSPKSDVFSFGLIIFELLAGEPAFSANLTAFAAAKELLFGKTRPEIPKWIGIGMRELIEECWAQNPDERPSFEDIFERLQGMAFRVMPGVNSAKVLRFVDEVIALEKVGDH